MVTFRGGAITLDCLGDEDTGADGCPWSACVNGRAAAIKAARAHVKASGHPLDGIYGQQTYSFRGGANERGGA